VNEEFCNEEVSCRQNIPHANPFSIEKICSAVNFSSVSMEAPYCTLSVEIERPPQTLHSSSPFLMQLRRREGGVSGSAPMIEAGDRVNHVF
jgi:hypothetical protein